MTQHTVQQFYRYLLINSSVLLLGFGSFQVASLFIPLLFAKISSIPITLISGFFLTRTLVFKI
jgi:putative flippase GtrA